ncbi:MAG: hypothetical protein EZS28_034555 [Streblomastix strix]|uniref:Selenoprotein F n=1 Tax=Streblomastix strix TaxID=222440 RepID=A0A5J4UHM4_9EUKA|nr:MAG: hypothetical protein EZS28_034555 [Streblomastix strix]
MIIILTFALTTILNAVLSEDAEFCQRHGFDSTLLECETCGIVEGVTSSSALTDICHRCCNTFEIVKAKKAVFSYDFQRISAELAEFIQNEAESIVNLHIRPSRGTVATLTLLDDKGRDIESFPVNEWNSKDIKDFLKDKLEK